jgi:dienelactone hydrolase
MLMARRTSSRRFAAQALVLALATALLAGSIPAADVLRGAVLVVRAAGVAGPSAERLVRWTDRPVSVRDLSVPSRHGTLRGRLYRPTTGSRRTLVLTAGVHAEGIDEPRLVKLARDFAGVGLAVLTPELPDLLDYRITPRLPDMLEDTVAWAAASPLATDGRVGLVGISFSGGLSVVAAGRSAVADRVAFTVSFGGHGDLGRTLRYLCTGQQPDGGSRPPHDYGVVIILLNGADRLVPADQVGPLRAGIRTFLRASHVDMVDHARAKTIFDEAIALEAAMPEPARTLLHYVNTRDVARLGPLLLPHVGAVTTDPSLSPERSPAPTAPVFLLHGADDNVIPAAESQLLGGSLDRRGARVRVLLTKLITHAEVDRPATPAEIWQLLSFWGDVLAR